MHNWGRGSIFALKHEPEAAPVSSEQAEGVGIGGRDQGNVSNVGVEALYSKAKRGRLVFTNKVAHLVSRLVVDGSNKVWFHAQSFREDS